MKKFTILSLGLHISLIIVAFSLNRNSEHGSGDSETASQEDGSKDSINGSIVDKPIEVVKVSPEIIKAMKEQDKQMAVEEKYRSEQKNQSKCLYSFGGIGVTFEGFGDRTISEIHKGYPAYRAGLRVGDRILNTGNVRGPVGSQITITFEREGVIYDVDLVRDKICVESVP